MLPDNYSCDNQMDMFDYFREINAPVPKFAFGDTVYIVKVDSIIEVKVDSMW